MMVWSALSLGLGRSIRGLGRSAEAAWAGRSHARPKRLVSAMIMTPGKRRWGLRVTVCSPKSPLFDAADYSEVSGEFPGDERGKKCDTETQRHRGHRGHREEG